MVYWINVYEDGVTSSHDDLESAWDTSNQVACYEYVKTLYRIKVTLKQEAR
jgi:hypothetical protein